MGVLFQLNIMSLAGIYGPEAFKKSHRFLMEEWYDFYGSDIHRLAPFRKALAEKALTAKEVKALQELKEKAILIGE